MSDAFASLKPKKKASLTVELDAELKAKTKDAAKKRGVKLNEIVERAFQLFVDETKGEKT